MNDSLNGLENFKRLLVSNFDKKYNFSMQQKAFIVDNSGELEVFFANIYKFHVYIIHFYIKTIVITLSYI
jgi:hypothetical protein